MYQVSMDQSLKSFIFNAHVVVGFNLGSSELEKPLWKFGRR